jgi:hypothetical protein
LKKTTQSYVETDIIDPKILQGLPSLMIPNKMKKDHEEHKLLPFLED